MSNILHVIHEDLWKIKMAIIEQGRKIRYHRKLVESNAYHNSYMGKRCFIIGLGPSLTISDLERLEGEYTFASNGIFRYFDETKWRPSFYSVCDRTYFGINKDMCLSVHPKKSSFYPLDFINEFGMVENANYYSRIAVRWKRTRFSTSPIKGLSEGSTITYFLIQLAAFMGFSEVYLLGVDFNYSKTINDNGVITENNGVSNYAHVDPNNAKYPVFNPKASLESYKAAKKYCDMQTKFTVYNATRGGKLEVFPRVEFDSLFPKKR